MTCYACLFEAKSIQEYILRSGRLRHIVGASELLDSLTPTLVDDVLYALGLMKDKEVRFSRCAGGSVYMFTDSETACNAFRDLWSLAVRQYAPGLEFVIATGNGTCDFDAFETAGKQLQAARNRQPPTLPAGTPVTRYAPRTGEPAVTDDKTLGLQDQATARFGLGQFWRKEKGGLTSRFAAELPTDAWPRNLDYDPNDEDKDATFPFLRDNRYLALLHADGNGLGALIQRLSHYVKEDQSSFVPLFRDFSAAVAAATVAAAREATSKVLIPARNVPADESQPTGRVDRPLSARPIVLGGDDLTILLRADLALPFARAFLTAFEAATRTELAKVRQQHPTIAALLPDCLTAGGGIAFVKSNHPFHLTHDLAESIAGVAKRRAKEGLNERDRIPPTLAFHRVTTACHGDYRDILKNEMTCGPTGAQVITTLGVYGLDDKTTGLPTLADLESLAALLGREDMARGPARRVLTLLGQDQDDARRGYARWREVMGEREPDHLKTLDRLLEQLCSHAGGLDKDLPVSANGTPHHTPLGDVTALLAVTQGAYQAQAADAEGEQ